jgi:hypothetical protein
VPVQAIPPPIQGLNSDRHSQRENDMKPDKNADYLLNVSPGVDRLNSEKRLELDRRRSETGSEPGDQRGERSTMKRNFWITLFMCGVVLLAQVDSAQAAPSLAKLAANSSDVGCGWEQEFGTQAQTDCEAILNQLKATYGISWEAPTDPAIRLYDFNNRALRRWKIRDAQALKDALDAWARALGGVDAAKRQLGLETLTFKLRGQNYMLRPGDLAEYIDAWDEIDVGSLAIQAVDIAHELAHRWERHHETNFNGQFPTFRTLQFKQKFFKGYDSKADAWIPDGGGWTEIARGTTGHYNGAHPEEDFAETASHVVMRTEIAQRYKNSDRYQFMVSLMPGLH